MDPFAIAHGIWFGIGMIAGWIDLPSLHLPL